MLFNTHYDMLLLSIKLSKLFKIDSQNNKINFNNKNISDNDINNLITGLIYPDLPCSYYYIKEQKIQMEIRLCSIIQLAFLGKNMETAIKSQIEDSHNGKFSINHSMSYSENLDNEYIRDLIVARCIIILYSFFETGNFAYLGYLIHIIQDAYSTSHTNRIKLNSEKKNIRYSQKDVENKIKSTKFIKEDINLDNINIDYNNINRLIYYILDDDNNRKLLLDSIKSISANSNIENLDLTNFINLIIKLLLSLCNTDEKKLIMVKILFGWWEWHSDYYETISISNINPEIMIDGKIEITKIEQHSSKILQNITYKNLSHSLRRLYKIVTHYLYDNDIIERIYIQTGGKSSLSGLQPSASGKSSLSGLQPSASGSRLITSGLKDNTIKGLELEAKRLTNYFISSFLYYPKQDKETHKNKDCGYVLFANNEFLFTQAIIDIKIILELSLTEFYKYQANKTKDNAKESITKIYNYLINNTFYLFKSNDFPKINNDKSLSNNNWYTNLKCLYSSALVTTNNNIKSLILAINQVENNYKLNEQTIKIIESNFEIKNAEQETIEELEGGSIKIDKYNEYKQKYKIYKTKYILSQLNKLN